MAKFFLLSIGAMTDKRLKGPATKPRKGENKPLKNSIMKTTLVAALLSSIVLLFAALPAGAQTTNADFQQAVAVYQQSHSQADAEKVIKLAAALDRLPLIPEEARKHFVMGQTIFNDAKKTNTFSMAGQEFSKAVVLAPWWPEARYNLAVALEAEGDYANAIVTLKLYQLFKLSEIEARAIQDKIYALEARQDLAAKETENRAREMAEAKAKEAQAAAEEKAVKERESSRIRQFCGTWDRVSNPRTEPGRGLVIVLNGAGELAVESVFGNTDRRNATISIEGRRIKIHSPGVMSDGWTYDWDLVLSNDGATLSGRFSRSEPQGMHSAYDEEWRRE